MITFHWSFPGPHQRPGARTWKCHVGFVSRRPLTDHVPGTLTLRSKPSNAVIYGNHLSSLLPATPFGPSFKYPKRGLGGKPLSFVLNLALPRSMREDCVSGNVDAAPPKHAKSVVKFEKQSPTRHFRQRIQITTAADYLLWLLSSLSNGGGRTSGAGIVREGARLNN
jgi:hypothetical protein